MKGINEDQWEDEEHDKDFSTRVSDGSCGKIIQYLNLKYCTLGKYHEGFEPFISFISITWTRPTLQPLNKALLEVLLIESTHLALIIFYLGLRRKIAQDYQAPLANIFKRQNFTNSQVNDFFFLSSKHSFCLLPVENNSQVNKFPNSQKFSNLQT